MDVILFVVCVYIVIFVVSIKIKSNACLTFNI